MTETCDGESICLNPRIRYRAVGYEGVIVHLDSARVIVVSEVGLRVLQALSEPTSREKLATVIADEFIVSEPQAREDIDAFLGQLEREQVIDLCAQQDSIRE